MAIIYLYIYSYIYIYIHIYIDEIYNDEMGLPTVVEASEQDPLSCGTAERVLCQCTFSQAFFNTLQVVFWKHSPKILDFTGYYMSLHFADLLFFSFICHDFETNTS